MAPLHPRTGNILQSCLSFNFGLLASYRKTFRQADCCGRLQTIRLKRQVQGMVEKYSRHWLPFLYLENPLEFAITGRPVFFNA